MFGLVKEVNKNLSKSTIKFSDTFYGTHNFSQNVLKI